jgi:hypothetical protein
MATSHLLLAAALTFGLLLQAAPPAPPEDLPAAIQRQVAARETLKAQAEEAQAALRKWYEGALDLLKKDSATKGDLDAVIATDTERGRMERDLTPEEKAALPKLLRDVRGQYDQARAQQADRQKAAVGASLREYMATLEGLEKRFTQKLDLDAAIAVRKERAAAGAELSGAPATAPATATPAPAPPQPAGAVLPPAGSGKAAPVLQVGSELKAWGRLASPAREAISFECPGGPGRGGRAVVLKNDPTTGRNGSTWTVDYTRTGEATSLQFVHPYREGQVVVTMRKTGLDIDTKGDWTEHGWWGYDRKRIKKTQEGAALFPLQDEHKYEVVSQLGATGDYVIKIDGKVAGTAQVSSASGLTFPQVVEALPKNWPNGAAALLVGPVVGDAKVNKNVCEKLTFQASAP